MEMYVPETHLILDSSDLIINRVQDVEPILEHNKELRSQEQRSDWGRHIASVPAVILEKWLNEEYARGNTTMRYGSQEFWNMVRKKLDDPDWAYLRVDGPKPSIVGFGD